MTYKVKLGKEIVVTSQNKVGALAGIVKILADRGVDITAISAQGAGGVGLINLVVDDHLHARDLLEKKGVTFRENGVLLIEAEDKPGALLRIAKKLAAKKIEILNVYGSAPG